MKKHHALAGMLLIGFFSVASAQVRIGLKGGLNLASVALSQDYLKGLETFHQREVEVRMLPSYHIGLQAEFDFGTYLGMGFGLQWSGKGYRSGYEYTVLNKDFKYAHKSTPSYIQAPLNFYFRTHHFFAAVGGYAGLGMNGKHDTRFSVDDTETREEVELEFTDEYDPDVEDDPSANYSPLDYGASVELGYEISKFRISAAYQFGLSNTFSKEYVDFVKDVSNLDVRGRHRVIGISVAFLFGDGLE